MNVGANRQLAAEHGARYIDNTYGKIFGDFCFITAVSASTLTVSGSNITNATSVTLAQGQTIRGRYTELTVSSGAVICYNSRYPKVGGIYTSSTFPYDDTIDWAQFGTPPVYLQSGSTVTSTLGKVVTLTSNLTHSTLDPVLSDCSTGLQDVTWFGGFNPGSYILFLGFNSTVQFQFPSSVRGIGFDFQSSIGGSIFSIDLTLKDASSNPILTQFSYGLSTYPRPKSAYTDPAFQFIGFESSTQNIRYASITSEVIVPNTNAIRRSRFAIGKLYIKT